MEMTGPNEQRVRELFTIDRDYELFEVAAKMAQALDRAEDLPKLIGNANQRIWDLLRYCRGKLHSDQLISNDEYSMLAQDHPAVERLETYDQMKATLDHVTALVAHAKTKTPCAEHYSILLDELTRALENK